MPIVYIIGKACAPALPLIQGAPTTEITMATGTAAPPATSAPATQDRKTVQVIERQLGRARFHVKLVDLLCQAALLSIGTLAYLLLAAVADHWFLPGGLGFIGRALAFVGLAALWVWFAVKFLAPLLLRGINPTYAARTIEEAQPSLKNSLINFLLLRQDRGGVREAVFEAVEQKAASDIATVKVESAVDRTPIIRVGYVLVGVLAVCAAYKILSPKDPFRTAARVVMPWADIARPSRVKILEVTPGSTKVYHGHTVEIAATIDGTSEDSPVWLVYSTADGQTLNRKLRMKAGAGGIQFKIVLPPEEEQSPAATRGLQQDVNYRIEAGDALTEEYRLTVVAAPTIVVQQLELEFPAYTNKPKQTLDKQGDIQALEGTKVTIHALANQSIQSAFVELDPNDSPQGAAEVVPLLFDGQHASGTITLQLAKDRVSPWRTSYQVRFINDEGQKSEQPIRYQIDVLRDLPPEVQILAPTERRIEIPENGSRTIEVRATDPDFGLTRLALRGEVRGKPLLEQELLKAEGPPPPQATAKFVFVPAQHGLKAGDEMLYQALAADNRTNPTSGSADPNVTTTSSYIFVIVPPEERPQNQDMPPPEGDKPPPMEGEKPMAAGDKPPMPGSDKPENAGDDKQPKSDQPKEGEKSQQPKEGEQPEQGEKGEKSQNPMQGGKDEKGANSGSKNSGQQQTGGGQKSDNQQGEQSGGEGSQSGAKGQSQPGGGKGQKSSGNPEQENPTDSASGESSPGSPTGSPSGNAAQKSGNQGGKTDETGQPTGNSDQPAGDAEQSSRPAHDGERIEQILKHRREKEQQSGQPGSKREESDSPQDSAAEPSKGQQAGDEEKNSTDGQEPKGGEPREGSQGEKTNGAKGQKGTEKGQKQDEGTDAESAAGQKREGGDKTGTQPQPSKGEKRDGQESENSSTGAAGQKQDGQPRVGEKGQRSDQAGTKGDKEQGAKSAGGADKKEGEGPTKDDAGAQGGKPQGPMKTDQEKEPQSGAGAKGEKKDPGMGKNGDSGAGQSGKDKKGAADSQEAGRDRQKDMDDAGGEPKESETSPPSGSKRQSDSKGGESGDKSGGGKQGGGQSANQAGNDSAGKNSAADEGAGAAQEIGNGKTGDQAGDQQKADGQTGAKGSEKGDGSTGKSGEGKSPAGGAPPPGAKQSAKNEPTEGDTPSQGSSGQVTGGGNQDRRPRPQGGETGQVPDSDDANLEYAKKQTDLALQYLKDQQHDPDPELLDRLGWTKEEMQEFLRRWDALQKAAAEDPKASHELDESLKSLGLKPATNRKRAGGDKSDSTRDLRDSGGRSSAPKTYRDQFDNFRKGSR